MLPRSLSSWGSRCNSIETGAGSSRCSAALRRARSSRVGPIVLWQPKTDERVKPAHEACAQVISTLYACPALQGCSPWMILPAWRAPMRRDRCRRPPNASVLPISPLAPSLFTILPFAQPAGHAWRHIPCHRSARHAGGLDRDTGARSQAPSRAHRSTSTALRLRPIAARGSRP
jgi:hypothetical protein